MAEKYAFQSPYAYAGNDPVKYIHFMGLGFTTQNFKVGIGDENLNSGAISEQVTGCVHLNNDKETNTDTVSGKLVKKEKDGYGKSSIKTVEVVISTAKINWKGDIVKITETVYKMNGESKTTNLKSALESKNPMFAKVVGFAARFKKDNFGKSIVVANIDNSIKDLGGSISSVATYAGGVLLAASLIPEPGSVVEFPVGAVVTALGVGGQFLSDLIPSDSGELVWTKSGHNYVCPYCKGDSKWLRKN